MRRGTNHVNNVHRPYILALVFSFALVSSQLVSSQSTFSRTSNICLTMLFLLFFSATHYLPSSWLSTHPMFLRVFCAIFFVYLCSTLSCYSFLHSCEHRYFSFLIISSSSISLRQENQSSLLPLPPILRRWYWTYGSA